MPKNRSPRLATIVPLLGVALTACAPGGRIVAVPEAPPSGLAATVIPAPAEVRPAGGAPFAITAGTAVVVETAAPEVQAVAEQLAHILRPATGFPIPVSPSAGAGAIVLRLGGDAGLGEEGYRLESRADRLELVANRAAGLFRGVQTIRQLLPATIEMELRAGRDASWTIPAGVIVDRPRFAWRGAMLDVARHFFSVAEVKQYIDALALYKINILHLHLSDDQGWRIEIRSRPQLAEVGGLTQVGGGPGGFYTQEEYAEIVRYAQERYMTVVPEIDMPGHTNAALVAFPQLSCGTRPPAPYTGTAVGFSTFCVDNEETYRLIEDVMRELAALTPGPWLHMGGDEVEALTDEQYAHFVERVQEIIARTGKQMVGWEEITKARLLPTTLSQQWKSDSTAAAVQQGVKLIMSPASRAYIDMKYDDDTEIGLDWAGQRDVEATYDWDPATFTAGITESDIVGVEAPLWTETVKNLTAAQYLVFPRLPAIAEIGWSPAARREWSSFRYRLAAQAPRWRILGINYYRSPQVPWGR
ncbi:MAG TPA: beta-N-acetylhexosaminidase [Longimicrobiaceae bacterium]